MNHLLTLTIPDALYQRLKTRAEQHQHSIEDEVVAILAAAAMDAPLPANLEADSKTSHPTDDATC